MRGRNGLPLPSLKPSWRATRPFWVPASAGTTSIRQSSSFPRKRESRRRAHALDSGNEGMGLSGRSTFLSLRSSRPGEPRVRPGSPPPRGRRTRNKDRHSRESGNPGGERTRLPSYSEGTGMRGRKGLPLPSLKPSRRATRAFWVPASAGTTSLNHRSSFPRGRGGNPGLARPRFVRFSPLARLYVRMHAPHHVTKEPYGRPFPIRLRGGDPLA